MGEQGFSEEVGLEQGRVRKQAYGYLAGRKGTQRLQGRCLAPLWNNKETETGWIEMRSEGK